MSPLVIVYVLFSLGRVEQLAVAKVSLLCFPPLLAAVSFPAIKGVCGSMCVNHTVSFVQHTTPLFALYRKGFGCFVGALDRLLTSIAKAVSESSVEKPSTFVVSGMGGL